MASTNWVFTLHVTQKCADFFHRDITDPDGVGNMLLNYLEKSNDSIRYVHYQLEYGKNPAAHYQGFLQTYKRCRFTTVKGLFGIDEVHVEKMYKKSTPRQADAYTEKEGIRTWTFGKRIEQGFRSDIEELCNLIKDGKMSLAELAQQEPLMFVQYGKRFQELAAYLPHPESKRINFEYRAKGDDFSDFEDIDTFTYCGTWCGYSGQKKCIIFEDSVITRQMEYLTHSKFPWIQIGYQRFPFTSETVLIITDPELSVRTSDGGKRNW